MEFLYLSQIRSIATKRKAHISIEIYALNVTIKFDLGQWNEKQTYRLKSRPQMWSSGLTLTMTLTFSFQG